MKQLVGAFVVASVAGLGCGGGSGEVEIDEFVDELGVLTCEKLFDCCTDPELMAQFEGIDPPIDTIDDCKDFYSGILTALLAPSIRDGEEGGRLVYHGDRAGACLDAIAGLSCAEFAASLGGSDFGGCESPIEPLVETGGTCFSDDECISGYCDDDGDGGVCAELPVEGEACTVECASGLRCAFDTGTGERVCQALLADGSECDADDACRSGYCEGRDPQAGTPGTCSSATTCDGV